MVQVGVGRQSNFRLVKLVLMFCVYAVGDGEKS
jgi:hypothetical protein